MLRRTLLATIQDVSSKTVCSPCASRLTQQSLRVQQRAFSETRISQQIAVIRGHAIEKTYFGSRAPDHTTIGNSQLAEQSRVGNEFQAGGQTKVLDGSSVVGPSTTFDRSDTVVRRRRRKDDNGITDQPLPQDASAALSKTASSAPPRSLRRMISTYLALTKPRLAFLIVLTTTAAYSIYPIPALLSTSATAAPSLSTLTLAFLTTGTFMTVASANTLNMLFEPQHDAKMSRTRNRPLVRNLLSKRAAFLFALATGLCGFGTLWLGVNPTTALLGAGNLVLYAFIYTPFKRIHPVNTWIGAVVGAIPPLMGWVAAASQYSTRPTSGSVDGVLQESKDLLFTEQAVGGWLLAALLFAWQFPHFFALSHAVRQEYASAGYKMLTSTNIPMAARVSLRYSMFMFPICCALTVYGITDPAFVATSSVINAWMLKEAWRFWKLNGEKGSARALFWASVWQLPIALVMAMVLKRGLWERIMTGIFGVGEIDDEEMEVEG